MLQRMLAVALILIATANWVSPEAASAQPGQPAWLRIDTERFEIHYPAALARELDRVVRSAERAYDHVGGRLSFTLPTKVPLLLFAPSGPFTQEAANPDGVGERIPRVPHRSRILLPLPEDDGRLDALIVHELTHILVGELVMPGAGGDNGLARWVNEGIAAYMVGAWPDDHERLMRELVASGKVPALSQLAGDGRFPDARLNDAIGHAAFDYIESRWGAASIRRFLDALIVPRRDNAYDSALGLAPAEFDAAFRQHMEIRFRPIEFGPHDP